MLQKDYYLMLKNKLIIVGYDLDLVDQINWEKRYELVGIIDEKIIDNKKYIGNDNQNLNNKFDKSKFIFAIDDPQKKKTLYLDKYSNRYFENFCSSYSYISKDLSIGRGNIIQNNAKIMSNVFIGDHCKINIDCTLHHEVFLGNFNTIAPGARLLGNVTVGNNVFIGAEVTVLPGIKIEDGAIIGAGAVVTKDVKKNKTIYGVPAK